MLCVVLYYKANLFHFSLLDGKEYFFVFSTKISSLLIVMEARNLFCYLHISRISTISSAVSCLQQPEVMTVLSAMARMMSSSRVIPISVKVVGRPTSRMNYLTDEVGKEVNALVGILYQPDFLRPTTELFFCALVDVSIEDRV